MDEYFSKYHVENILIFWEEYLNIAVKLEYRTYMQFKAVAETFLRYTVGILMHTKYRYNHIYIYIYIATPNISLIR